MYSHSLFIGCGLAGFWVFKKKKLLFARDFYKEYYYERSFNLEKGDILSGEVEFNLDSNVGLAYQFKIVIEIQNGKQLKKVISSQQMTDYKKYGEIYDLGDYTKVEFIADLGELFEIPQDGRYKMKIEFATSTFPNQHVEFLKAELKIYKR